MIALYDAVEFTTMLFFIQKILRFNLGVAFLKSVSIYTFFSDLNAITVFRTATRVKKRTKLTWKSTGFT